MALISCVGANKKSKSRLLSTPIRALEEPIDLEITFSPRLTSYRYDITQKQHNPNFPDVCKYAVLRIPQTQRLSLP
ncbi:hypothetical protein [Nostoc sp. NMS4]|uniref:hypothetical protein n=1 Tax=Nostoc sp. NMS4 TaxID=2815390 RepID=UPI0025DFE2BF|nr:hypothetical protein [Nostoc sp. NMS4]MBN3926614.1 hypothetical protein [Nostoc sp. NMS4]